MKILLKRIYEPAEDSDGFRVLVDRLWPRGESKEKAAIDIWLKDLAPSAELRKWFNHEAEKWDGFQKKYRQELDANPGAVAEFAQAAKGKRTVTLLYGAKDAQHNQAVVLREYLASHAVSR